ncbi:hypothetical protein B6D60_00725 [candidate division KSB1 bacterium 4484_87]|nr:MAG: hypothetical protein B6D60_00725 [candidate division KSB1 bacterium 4484_87]
MNKKSALIQGVLFWGSLWGIWEIVGDRMFADNPLIPREVALVGIAVLILAVSRTFHNIRGFSMAMAVLAAMFKFLNAPFWGCQFFAVILLGVTFEIFWALFVKNESLKRLSFTFAGVGATGLHFLLFIPIAIVTTNAAFWLKNGGEKIFQFLGEGLLTMVDVFVVLFFTHKLIAKLPKMREQLISWHLNWIFSASMVFLAILTAFNR